MWAYIIATGEMKRGTYTAHGYSGLAECKDQPDLDCVPNRGPIPRGEYRIGPAIAHHPTAGAFVIPLAPMTPEKLYGRKGFLIHGDNADHTASHGCIILPRAAREAIVNSKDKDLRVVRDEKEYAKLTAEAA